MARIDQLPAQAKYLLQLAAVIGTDIPVSLLITLAALPHHVVQANLAYLQASEFLYEMDNSSEPTYTFKHVLTQEVAYQAIHTSVRQLMHQRIAQILAEQCPDTVAPRSEVLAQPCTEGCDTPELQEAKALLDALSCM